MTESILFINDTSIYLQSGDYETILSTVRAADTLIANGYYGRTMEFDFDTGISMVERELMDKLIMSADIVIKL